MSSHTRRDFLGAAAAGVALAAAPVAAIEPVRRTGAPRLRLGLSAFSYKKFLYGTAEPRMTLADFLDRAVALDVDGVELTEYFFPKPATTEYATGLRRQCFRLGLPVSGSAMRNTFTLPPGPERTAEIATCKAWIDRCSELGAPCIRVFVGGLQKDQTVEDARRLSIEALEECCAYAGTRGISLALENHGGIVSDAEGTLAIAKAVRSDWFGVNLDVGNFRTADPYADIAQCAPYAITVHFKTDITPRGAATREIDYGRVTRILRDAGYRGFVTLEYEGTAPPLEAVPAAIKRMRAALR